MREHGRSEFEGAGRGIDDRYNKIYPHTCMKSLKNEN